MHRFALLFVLAAPLRLDAGSALVEHVAPDAAAPGDLVAIIGSGFGGEAGGLSISGLRLSAEQWSARRISFRVPAEAVSGPLVVRPRDGAPSVRLDLSVRRELAAEQFEPRGFELLDTGLLGSATLVEADRERVYAILGFETLAAYATADRGPCRLLSRVHLRQRVADIRLHGGHLYVCGDHGLQVYRTADLALGIAEPVACVFDGTALSVDAKDAPLAAGGGALVALSEYRPRPPSETLSVAFYSFRDGELTKLGVFRRAVVPTERQHAMALDPGGKRAYVSGFETIVGDNAYLLEIDISDPAHPVLDRRTVTGGVLLFDMETRGNRMWAGVLNTGTELFRSYGIDSSSGRLSHASTVRGGFGFGRTSRVKIIDDRTAAGSAWLGARPDVFLLDAAGSGDAPLASIDSFDWAFDVAGFALPSGGGRIVVADEWGGISTHDWSRGLQPTLGPSRSEQWIVSAAMTEGLHIAKDRIYVAGRGAGVWSADRHRLDDPQGWRRVPWSWGEDDPQPHPASGVATREDPKHGTLIAVLGHEKAMAWGRLIHGLLYRETSDRIELLAASSPLDPPGLFTSGEDVVWAEPDLVFMATGTDGFRAFVVDPDLPRISFHADCEAAGFATDIFSEQNAAVFLRLHREGGRCRLIVGSRPGILVPDPTIHVFEIAYPEGVPDRAHPQRHISVVHEASLECTSWKPIQGLEVRPSGIVAAATGQGVALLRLSWIEELNALPAAEAWRRIAIPVSTFEPSWNTTWSPLFDGVGLGSDEVLYAVKSPVGVWRIAFEMDPARPGHTSSATAYYPGVQCGMDYTQFLHGWGNPDLETLHHPYALAAEGESLYVTGWSGKVHRLSAVERRPAPTPPSIEGASQCRIRQARSWTLSSPEPQGIPRSFQLDWGDGTTTPWIGPYPSGTNVALEHEWLEPGIYVLRAAARGFGGRPGESSTLALRVRPLCGDCNADGRLDIADPAALLSHLFQGGSLPAELEDADTTSDGKLDISDAVSILLHLYADSRTLCPAG